MSAYSGTEPASYFGERELARLTNEELEGTDPITTLTRGR